MLTSVFFSGGYSMLYGFWAGFAKSYCVDWLISGFVAPFCDTERCTFLRHWRTHWSLCANACVTHLCMYCPSSSLSKLWYIFLEEQPENGTVDIYVTHPPHINIYINFILKRFRISFWSSVADLRTRTSGPGDEIHLNLTIVWRNHQHLD